MKQPIDDILFFERPDGSQYAKTVYRGGEVVVHERDEWLANGWSDFWNNEHIKVEKE